MRIHTLMCAAAALMLGGCVTLGAPITTEVEVPVGVPCKITPPARPAFAVDGLPIGSDIWEQMKALRAERQTRVAYEVELEAAVKECQ